VFHSSDASVANGQISWCAVLEIPLSIALYGALAYYSPWPWFSLLACMAAPLLLLRSAVSVRRGKAMLWRYMRRGKGLRKTEVLAVAAVSALFSYWVSDAWAAQWLMPHIGWALFWRSALIGVLVVLGSVAVSFASAGLVAGAAAYAGESESEDVISGVAVFAGAGAITGTLPLVVALAGLGLVSIAFSLVGVLVGVLLSVIAVVALEFWLGLEIEGLVIAMTPDSVLHGAGSGRGISYIASGMAVVSVVGAAASALLLVPAIGLGAFTRITWIRVLATLQCIFSGLAEFSQNWRETVLVVDLWHLPTLLPGAEQVNQVLDAKYLMKQASENWVGALLKYALIGLVCLPALLYRWNIKASAWLWGPLAFALRPAIWANEESMRETMSKQTTWPLLGLMFAVALGLGTWLLGPWLDPSLASEVPTWLSKLAQYLPAPAPNLRTALLAMTLVSWLCFLCFAYSLRAAHDAPLGNAHDYEKLTVAVKQRFRHLAKPVRISSQWTAALAFLTVWMYALKWALNRWPEDLQNVVWAWLKPWL